MSAFYKERIAELPRQSLFLFGPRGSGKSMWLRHVCPDAYVVDLLDEEVYQRLLANPGLFAAELRTVQPERWVLVDEVQRLPNLLNEVHRFIEQKRLRFILCGSSDRKLKRAGVNLLAGRALKCAMHPFVPEELGPDFDIDDALLHGLLPIVWDAPDREATLASYAQLYLREEIQLRRGSEFIAIEAKSGSNFTRKWCKGLRAIEALPGLRRRIVVYPRGPSLRTEDDIDVLAFADFAAQLSTDRVWG